MSSLGARDGPRRGATLGTVAAGLLLLTTLILQWQGYSFGGRNHSIHVPLVKSLLDPTLYRFDLLLESFDGFATFFFHGVALLAGATGNLELVYFVLYVVSLAALVSGAYALGLTAFGHPGTAVLTALLFVSQLGSLAGESSHWPGLTHAEFAGAGLIWSLVLHLRGRRRTAMGLAGLLFNLHGLSSLYVAAMLVADGVAARRERGWRELIENVALWGLLAAPTGAWILASALRDPIVSLPHWLHILRERSSLHAFPLATGLVPYARFAILLALGWLGLRATPPGPLHRHVVPFAAAVAILCVLSVVFAEWIPVPTIIRAQLMRSTKWLAYLGLAAVARLVTSAWGWGGAARPAAVLAVLGVMLREPTWMTLALALLLLARPASWGAAPVVAGCGALALTGWSGAFALPPGLGVEALAIHLERLLQGPAAPVCGALYVLLRAAPSLRASRAAQALALVTCLGWLLPRSYETQLSDRRDDSWKRVQDWARETTEPDALFLTPPMETGFRVFSERSVVGEWKDGTQQFFANRYAVRWWDRMRAMGGQGEAYHQMGRRLLLQIGRAHGASYLVFWSGKPLVLPREFETPDWIVYRLREMSLDERLESR